MRKMTQVLKWAKDSNKLLAQVGLWVANKHLVGRWSPSLALGVQITVEGPLWTARS